ncbi:MAG: DUF2934 domain-containing protein [Opitutaceae bacterium]|nr:DUF2934 domain-containing protein [Opitutaceae bacterium]
MTLRDHFAGLKSSDGAAREEILHRAYSIWESKGRPDNEDLAHWLAAELEIFPLTTAAHRDRDI